MHIEHILKQVIVQNEDPEHGTLGLTIRDLGPTTQDPRTQDLGFGTQDLRPQDLVPRTQESGPGTQDPKTWDPRNFKINH